MSLGSMKRSVNDLRVPTKLEKRLDVKSPLGGLTFNWEPLLPTTIFVNDKVLHGYFVQQGGEELVLDRHIVTMRYIPNVQIPSGSRARFNGTFGIWYIKTITDPDNQKHWLVAECTEVAP